MKTNQNPPLHYQSHHSFRLLPQKTITFTLNSLNRLASLLDKVNVSPNTLSVISLLLGLGAGVLFAFNLPLEGGLLIILCGLFDILDGKVAQKKNQKSLFGAFFDSTLDRYAEFFIYFGLAFYYRNHWALWLVVAALFSSLMVSYTRARAEGLGIECRTGVMQRAERILLLSLGTIIGALTQFINLILIPVMGIIFLISTLTAFQRTFHVRKMEKGKK